MNKGNLKRNILGILIGGVTAIVVVIILVLFISFLYKDCCICRGGGNGCCPCPPEPNSELCFHRPEHEDCKIDTFNTDSKNKEGENGKKNN